MAHHRRRSHGISSGEEQWEYSKVILAEPLGDTLHLPGLSDKHPIPPDDTDGRARWQLAGGVVATVNKTVYYTS